MKKTVTLQQRGVGAPGGQMFRVVKLTNAISIQTYGCKSIDLGDCITPDQAKLVCADRTLEVTVLAIKND